MPHRSDRVPVKPRDRKPIKIARCEARLPQASIYLRHDLPVAAAENDLPVKCVDSAAFGKLLAMA
jgi:hypothetical protein